jgi:thiol-disulfide isomerase/thioredoxin
MRQNLSVITRQKSPIRRQSTVINTIAEYQTGPSVLIRTGPSIQLITGDLAAVVEQPSRMASRFIRAGLSLALSCLLLTLAISSRAGDFTVQDLQGKTHSLAAYRGKWVLVNFWATWCPPCLSELPELSSLHTAHQDKDLVVIGIVMDSGSRKKVADFVQAHGISYPIAMGDSKTAAQIGEVDVLPTSYLYSPGGELVSYQAGAITRENVEAYIKSKQLN